MNRIFIEPTDLHTVEITGEDAKHLQVLRINGGDVLPLSDGHGKLYDGTVTRVTPHSYIVDLSEPCASRESVRTVTLYQALCKGDKNETIIQKSVELGVSKIVFFVSDACVARPDGKETAKLDRYRKIAHLAAMQSGREVVPEVDGFLTFAGTVDACRGTTTMFFYEKAVAKLSEALKDLPQDGDVNLIVGCEGGFSEKEAKSLTDAGCPALSLGPRILRAETAPVAALAVLMAHFGEI